MVSKNQIKLITSLQQKKYRNQHQLFFAETKKVIDEFLDAKFELVNLFTVDETLFPVVEANKMYAISEAELKKISALKTPNECLAIFKMPKSSDLIRDGLILALDDIRDPGNLGTIVRLCDWFGIETLVCSTETVDVYNPKVIQSTMGSISRVKIVYADLISFLQKVNLPVYGTFMDGENVYNQDLIQEAVIVMGNEANGISPEIEALVTHKIAIPRFGKLQKTESLNVATATAITLSEFRRNN